ncbi:MAG: plasma-membrane proton-efflux P-type ATPase [Phycisphaerae bacterium]|nr:plasma-membrane proton-efflux P-type ATPase [Phycisphaerae bacterium]
MSLQVKDAVSTQSRTDLPPIEELPSRLEVSPDIGLSSAEASSRLSEYGPNELTTEKTNPLLKFLHFFWGPIPWMIEAAVILSAIVGDWVDFGIILVLLFMNAVIGFWEEYQAGNAIEALQKKLALHARVRRDGQWHTVPARNLVPGDIIRIRLGDIIPADARLLDGDPVEIDQSTLTGESLPVERQTGDIVYSGAVMTLGETEALVYATGAHTYFGKTAQMVEEEGSASHFQKAVLKIGDYLIILALGLVALILVAAVFRHEHFMTVLRFALVLTVAAIPVALPTVLSVTLAVGARLLSAKQAIVRRLAAIEELAGIDVLCSDKTGTLTQNKLKLEEPVVFESMPDMSIVDLAALASRQEDQDPIDSAIFAALEHPQTLDQYHITHFQPFDPVHKRTEATIKKADGSSFKVSKGAPQAILVIVDTPSQVTDKVERAVNKLAKRGFRALGVARTDADGRWRYMGILPMYDPPRQDSKDTIEAAHKIGVAVKMVTGDQMAIGKEIASQIGMNTRFLDASIFEQTAHHQTGQLADSIETADGFAQVFPEHKYHIVDVLQQRGHIVGMTGDGVNDAPALKKADAGIAVSGATDAARNSAAIVLLTPGLSVIIDAIRESRKIFARMTSYAIYRIAETMRVLLFMTLSILIFKFYPVTAVMIVLLALLNDGAILSIAYDRSLISDRPQIWNMKEVLGIATILGVAGVVASFGLFYLAEHVWKLDRDIIQTLVYLKLSLAGHLTIFITRTRGPFWKHRPSYALLGAVIGTQIIATLVAVYGILMEPIGWQWAGLIWAYALVWFLVNDTIKLAAYRLLDTVHSGFLARHR